jgi:hypothetical protein
MATPSASHNARLSVAAPIPAPIAMPAPMPTGIHAALFTCFISSPPVENPS